MTQDQIKIQTAIKWLQLVEAKEIAFNAYYNHQQYMNKLSAPNRDVYESAFRHREKLSKEIDSTTNARNEYFKTALLIIDPNCNLNPDCICGHSIKHIKNVAQEILNK